MNLTPTLSVIDIETTGLKSSTNYILQLSAVKVDSSTFEVVDRFDEYVKPAFPYEIEQGAFEAHGLTKEFIEKNGKPLIEVAEAFVEFIGDDDILSYNGIRFDIPFIYEDFNRVGIDPGIVHHRLLDSYLIEMLVNSHKLSQTYQRYTGDEAECAHNSLCDVIMTAEVFKHQFQNNNLDQFIESGELKTNIVFPEAILDLNESQEPVFTGGKHEGKTVGEVIRMDPGYIKWLFTNVLTRGTKEYIMNRYYNTNASKNKR